MKELTKAEEQIMKILWHLEKAFVKDILDEMGAPKPAYNTVSTIIRTMEKKGFVGYKSYGQSHQYFPLIEKSEYTIHFMKRIISNYFDNSFKEMVSFYSNQSDMNINEIDEAIKMMQELKAKMKNNE